MQFLNPMVLFGLIALAIPVVIHLFNFKRPKRVFFTNVRFLRELKLESRRRSQLKHLVILIMRLLAYAALIFAFAMPVIRQGDQPLHHGKPLIVVYIDNSYSLQALGADGMLLEQALKRASEIAGYYQPADEFYLITNDFLPRYSRVVNRSDLLEMITTVKFSPVSRSAGEIFEKVEDLRKRSHGRDLVFYYVSDFQLSTVDVANASPVEGMETYLIPISAGSNTGNLFLDSVWMDIPVIRPGQIVDFHVRIGNTGSKAVEEVPVSLTLNGKEAAVGTVTIPGSSKGIMKLTTRIAAEGIYHGVINIDDHPVVFDDRFYIGTRVTQERRVLLLQGSKGEPALAKLFEGDSLFRFESRPATQIDFSSINRYDIIFCSGLQEVSSGLVQALQSFVAEGGALVVIPPALPAVAHGINPLLSALGVAIYGQPDTTDVRVSSINFDHPLYKGVYSERPANLAMPLIFSHHAIQPAASVGESVIMRMLNDRPLLLSSPAGKGMVYLFAAALDAASSTLAGHAEIFVPPVYNMALYSGVVPPLYYVTGKDKAAAIAYPEDPGEAVFRIKRTGDDYEFIPGHRNEPFGVLLFFEDQIDLAGNYHVLRGDQDVAPLAFNYPHLESDLLCADQENLQSWIKEGGYNSVRLISAGGKSVTEKLKELNDGIRLWRWFVIAALVFLIAETLLLRYWNSRAGESIN
jgi:hypothetical protein